MKNLPDEFPIRYAIIVSDWLADSGDDWAEKLQFYAPAESELLFRQLLLLLQKEPMNEDLLMPRATKITFKSMDVEIMNVAKLSAPTDWADKIEKGMVELVPEAKRYSTEVGRAFEIGLYSYRGAGEIPSFMVAHNASIKSSTRARGDLEVIKKLGFLKEYSALDSLYESYERIINNEITGFQFYEAMVNYKKPIYISIPHSRAWEILDNGFQEGIVRLSNAFGKKDLIKELNAKRTENSYKDERISVAICKSWEDLFAEEISSLYKMFIFCANCGKPLPFDCHGKYCPNNKENQKCIQERYRKRARKSRGEKSQI